MWENELQHIFHFHGLLEYKLVEPLYRTVGPLLSEKDQQFHFHVFIQKELKTYTHTKTYKLIFATPVVL